VTLVAGATTVAFLVLYMALQWEPGGGIVQRLAITTVFGWIAAMGYRLGFATSRSDNVGRLDRDQRGLRSSARRYRKRSLIMTSRLRRLTGVALLFTALAVVLGALLGDPLIESHDDREKFVEQVGNAADRIPAIYAFQVVEVAGGFLSLAAGLGLYLMLRERARGMSLAGLLLFVVSCVFEGGRAFVGAAMIRAADDYGGGGLAGVGSRSEDVLELVRVLAVLHFGYFLTAFAALGLGAACFAHALAWSTGFVPRWLGLLGLVGGGLLLLTPLAVTAEILFLPFFLGAVLAIVWLLAAGLWLALRPPGARAALGEHASLG
jgi:hypothetical protein